MLYHNILSMVRTPPNCSTDKRVLPARLTDFASSQTFIRICLSATVSFKYKTLPFAFFYPCRIPKFTHKPQTATRYWRRSSHVMIKETLISLYEESTSFSVPPYCWPRESGALERPYFPIYCIYFTCTSRQLLHRSWPVKWSILYIGFDL